MNRKTDNYVEIFDTTLRDGTQGEGISFSMIDKIKIARHLDQLGVDYIEGGYPLSNPKDIAFFEKVTQVDFQHAKICAFGMTRRRNSTAAEDTGMNALVNSGAPVIVVVGKTWDLHVTEVLNCTLEQNLEMIRDSVHYCATTKGPRNQPAEVFYDAEHFFDGYQANPDYALQTLKSATDGGAVRLVLCDTNGGTMPNMIKQIIHDVQLEFGDQIKLGIHCHNDSGLAVANSLAAIEAGAVQVQGTINGIGERCGNVDLTTVIANLQLKLNRPCLNNADALQKLTETSRFVYELANMRLASGQPYVGSSAFAHKGGMHVHAVNKLANSYEHIQPEAVGNTRRVLVSELSGVSNIAATLGHKFNVLKDRQMQQRVLERVQNLEHAGYQFETANGSFELLLRTELGQRKEYWKLNHYNCVIFKANDNQPITEAVVKVTIGNNEEHHVADGDGPVNALDGALRKCLEPHYPLLKDVELRDYKVRVVNPSDGTAAKVRVVVDFAVKNPDAADEYFSTIGVSENIVEASWHAIIDAFEYHLLECKEELAV